MSGQFIDIPRIPYRPKINSRGEVIRPAAELHKGVVYQFLQSLNIEDCAIESGEVFQKREDSKEIESRLDKLTELCTTSDNCI